MGDSKVAVGVVGNCMGVWGNCGEATEAAVGVATEAGAASVGVPVAAVVAVGGMSYFCT